MKNTNESLFIGGHWLPADGGETYTCLDADLDRASPERRSIAARSGEPGGWTQ